VRDERLRVGIVGSRAAIPCVLALVRRLAAMVVRLDGVVVSGGAFGADRAAHVGALDARGRTWAILPCGAPHITNPTDEHFFPNLLERGGTIIRPFADGVPIRPGGFQRRNGVLVALSQIVVVAQASAKSGSMNSAHQAFKRKREIWVVPGPTSPEFEGSWKVIDEMGGVMLRSEKAFERRLRELVTPRPALEGNELRVFEALGSSAKHPDEIALETGLATPAVTTALLTLALGDVVVEGSAGLFQRKVLV